MAAKAPQAAAQEIDVEELAAAADGGRSRAVLQRFQRLMSLLARNGPAASVG